MGLSGRGTFSLFQSELSGASDNMSKLAEELGEAVDETFGESMSELKKKAQTA